MPIFDTLLHSTTRSQRDLQNLAFFGTSHILTAAYPDRPFSTARDLWNHFEHLLDHETKRIRSADLTPCVALGVHPKTQPTRAHDELWEALPDLLTDPQTHALGVLAVRDDTGREWDLLTRQLALNACLSNPLPCLCNLSPRTTDTRLRIAWIQRLHTILQRLAFPPSSVVLLHMDWLCIDTAEALGFTSSLSIHPSFLTTQDALTILQHHNPTTTLLASALSPSSSDILSLSKIASTLQDHPTFSPSSAQRVLFDNAHRLFLPNTPNPSQNTPSQTS